MAELKIVFCKNCGKRFESYATNPVYCSHECYKASQRIKDKLRRLNAPSQKKKPTDNAGAQTSMSFSKKDLYKYKQRAIHSVKELGEISHIARSEHHETYGQYISHEQTLKSDHDMRIRHEVWKLNQEKAKEKKADEPISEGGKAVFKWVSHTKPKHTT